MHRLIFVFSTALLAAIISVAPGSRVCADEAARTATVAHLADGSLAAGEAELAAMLTADPSNQEARFGVGMIRFATAVDRLAAGLYQYGAKSPRVMGLPLFSLPVPSKRDPKPLAYEDIRALLVTFTADLSAAEKTLAGVDDPNVKLPIDLSNIALDVDGDGTVSDLERNVVSSFVRPRRTRPTTDAPTDTTVAFDLADAYWLRGYCNLMLATSEFLLAHDWHKGFEAAFHNLFADVVSPMADALAASPSSNPRRASGADIADAIAFIHLIRWPVNEPQRMLAVRDHLKQVIDLSRQTWEAIEAETDDDCEWLPGPTQRSAVVQLTVSEEQLTSWRAMLDEAAAVLGRKLMPHWRFAKGFILRRVFEEPRTFDLVLWIAGPAALPYLEDGPISTGTDWNDVAQPFGRGLMGYLFWFN